MTPSSNPTSCPCGTGKSFDTCCEPLIRGKAHAETAEQLMRSRYTAYHQKAVAYLVETTHPDSRTPELRDQIAAWSERARFMTLQVLRTQGGQAGDKVGKVEFVARYMEQGKLHALQENSRFKRYRNRWMYVDGEHT